MATITLRFRPVLPVNPDGSYLTPQETMAIALEKQRAGALDDAQALYERVLRSASDHPTLLTLLASVAYRRGADELADMYLERAIEVYERHRERDPDDAGLAAALANLLLARDRVAEAEALLAPARLPLSPARGGRESFAGRLERARRRSLPPILLTTMPKSASETIWNRLAEGLDLVQSHVSIGIFPRCCLVPHRLSAMACGGLIAKEHIAPTRHNLMALDRCGVRRLLVHLRDPRQATLSWANFVLDDVSRRPLAPIWRQVVPPAATLERGLGAVIDWSLEHYLPRLITFIRSWRAIADDPDWHLGVRFLSFEMFRAEPHAYVDAALRHFQVPREAFDWHAKADDVHLRRGETDEWREVLSRTQRRRASRLLPHDLCEAFGWTQ